MHPMSSLKRLLPHVGKEFLIHGLIFFIDITSPGSLEEQGRTIPRCFARRKRKIANGGDGIDENLERDSECYVFGIPVNAAVGQEELSNGKILTRSLDMLILSSTIGGKHRAHKSLLVQCLAESCPLPFCS